MNAPRSADLAALAVELADAVDEVWVEGDSWDITALREAQAKVRAAAAQAVPDTGRPTAAGFRCGYCGAVFPSLTELGNLPGHDRHDRPGHRGECSGSFTRDFGSAAGSSPVTGQALEPDLRCELCGRSTADSYEDMAAPVVYFVRRGLCHPCSRSTALPHDRPPADTGQAREPIQRGHWTKERNALAGKLLDHLVDYDAVLGRLPVDVCGAMAVRLANVVLSAGWQPPADTGQAPDVAALRSALRRVADVLDFADDAIDPPITTEIDTNIVRMALLDTEDAPPAELRRHVRALLGTDTTPDRLAWISEAGETAAAARQARYEETACARRPAEEHPDA